MASGTGNTDGGASDAAALSAMLQRTQCPVCWDQYTNNPTGQARCLLCSHLVCTGCLTNLTQNDVVTCPICRRLINTRIHPPPIVREVGYFAEEIGRLCRMQQLQQLQHSPLQTLQTQSQPLQQPPQPLPRRIFFTSDQPPSPAQPASAHAALLPHAPRPQQQQQPEAQPFQVDWEQELAVDTRELNQGMWDFDDGMGTYDENRQAIDQHWEQADDMSGSDIDEIQRAFDEQDTDNFRSLVDISTSPAQSMISLTSSMAREYYDRAGGFIPDNTMNRGFMRSTSSSSISSDVGEEGGYVVPSPDRSMIDGHNERSRSSMAAIPVQWTSSWSSMGILSEPGGYISSDSSPSARRSRRSSNSVINLSSDAYHATGVARRSPSQYSSFVSWDLQ